MMPEFTAHNIRLPDGRETLPRIGFTMDRYPQFLAAKRLLSLRYAMGDASLVDLGCLEGGYSVEFARLGFDVTGVEVRDSNFACCRYVRDTVLNEDPSETIDPARLSFIQDDVWNIARRGIFDVTFCCGLFYHLDRPREFARLLGSITRLVLILNTHYAPRVNESTFTLSDIETNEGMEGRWYQEFHSDQHFEGRDAERWSSWNNRRSFWLTKENILQALYEAGFGLVLEQFDPLSPNISQEILSGSYVKNCRSTFVGIKSH